MKTEEELADDMEVAIDNVMDIDVTVRDFARACAEVAALEQLSMRNDFRRVLTLAVAELLDLGRPGILAADRVNNLYRSLFVEPHQ